MAKAKAQPEQDLHARAILVSLRISSWSAKKFDKAVTKAATKAHGADESAGRFNKSLLPTAKSQTDSYKALMQHIAATRVWHYAQTLCWSDDGWQLLPIKNFQEYTDGIRERQHEFFRLLAAFVADYPALRDAAQVLLNGMFHLADYPKDIRARFSFGVEYAPVPQGGDFRVALSDSEIKALTTNTEARVKAAFQDAHKDVVTRLHETVSKIVARLSDPEAIFRDTLIGNARELCDVLGRLNVTDDPNLERLRRETELLAMTEPETLRKNDNVRVETAARAQSILDDMNATFGKGLLG